ncbi:MAG: hypothetical protein FWD34_06600 [Oscillospiraceae bacterium]|nr:hypothetical protein [Oscillospiraceae bacterium]
MNELFLFLLIFFGVFGAIQAVNMLCKFIIKIIYRKEKDTKIWTKP